MKACVLHAINDLRYEEVKNPVVKQGEVLINIKASGICGSDLPRVFDKGTYNFPTIPGHEFGGVIVEAENKELIGRKAAVYPLIPCDTCASCQIGEYAQCTNYNYFGSRCDGGFAEYISVPLFNLVFAEDNLSFEEIAMTEPSAVAIHALRQAGIEIGDNVAIFGAGPIGIMLAKWSSAWGADKVILVDIDKSKLDFAKTQGFENVLQSDNDTISKIFELTGGKGVDIAVEGAGVSVSLENCLSAAKNFGQVVLMGNPIGDMKLSQKAYWEILRKQLKLKGTWNSSYNLSKNDWSLSLNYMSRGKIDLKRLVSHKFNLSECNKAFNLMRERKEFFNKVMFIN